MIAIVLGGANTLHADERAALDLCPDAMIIACNHAGRDREGRVDHWATMHADHFPKWIAERIAAGRPDAGKLWHARHRHSSVGSTDIESWGGSSGMLCIAVAYELGVDKIMLAGVPMEQGCCHYNDRRLWSEARQYRNCWERHKPAMLGRVRSFSGWTMKLLGMPDRDWLYGDDRTT